MSNSKSKSVNMSIQTNPLPKKSGVIRVTIMSDAHNWHKGPASRKDDYMKASLAELEESLTIAENWESDYFLQVGDMYQKPEPHPTCRNLVTATLANHPAIRKLGMIGNHDVDGTLDKLDESALGTLFAAGLLEHASIHPEYGLACHDHRHSLVKELVDGVLVQNDMLIQVVHGSIATDWIFGEHILFDDLPVHPKTKVVIAGHVHSPMSMKRDDGVLFINPGSIARNKLNDEHFGRQPRLLIIDYTLDGTIFNPYLVELSSERSEDIFRYEEAKAKKNVTKNREMYVKQLTKSKSWSTHGSKLDRLRQAGAAKGIDPVIVDMACVAIEEITKNRTKERHEVVEGS